MFNTLLSDIADYGIKTSITHLHDKITSSDYLNYDLQKNLIMQYRFDKLNSEELLPFIEKVYTKKTNRTFNIMNVITFDEKIQWLKIYDSTPLKTEK